MNHEMCYIGDRKALLFGGDDSSYNDETWVYDPSSVTWELKTPSSHPSERHSSGMVYIGGNKALLFGGKSTPGITLNDTWIYDFINNRWDQDVNETNPPPVRYQPGLSETSLDGSSYPVLFGGKYLSYLRDDTWAYNCTDYSLPVELSSFTATAGNGQVTLHWITQTEVNNVGFSIYRSEEKNGDYTEIAFVKGAGNSGMPREYQFIDKEVETGKTYFYYLEDIDITGEKSKSEIIKVVVNPSRGLHLIVPTTKSAKPIPKEFRLLQNYPNPFNPETWLPYELAADAPVVIRIYNVKGQLVRLLNFGEQKAGYYVDKENAAYWDDKDKLGQSVSSGLYFYSLKAGDFQAVRRMVILK